MGNTSKEENAGLSGRGRPLTWATVHPSHAIERVRFELAFTEHVPKKIIDQARKIIERNRTELRFDPVQEIPHFVIGPAVTQQPSAGWSSLRMVRPGIVGEALQFHPEQIVYESTDYRKWETAKQRYLTVASEIVRLVSNVVDVRSVSLDYTDRFVFNGDPKSASPRELLASWLVGALALPALEGESLFHLHRGWFETVGENSYLFNQNVDAQDGATQSGAPVRSLQLWSRAQWIPVNNFDVEKFDVCLNDLHDHCLQRFADMASDKAVGMVGLQRKVGA